MRALDVRVEISGSLVPVGRIVGNDVSDARFAYLPSYLDAAAAAVSLSLPIREEPFTPAQTAAFFVSRFPQG